MYKRQAQVPASALVGSASFDYETVTINDQPYVAGGADLAAVHAMKDVYKRQPYQWGRVC